MPAARPLTVVTYNIHKGLSQFNRRLVLHDIDAGRNLELLEVEMRAAADARRSEIELARMGFRRRDEIAQRFPAGIGTDHQDVGSATKEREGTNPFTGEKMVFKAKPARKIVRARPVKAAKMAV